MSRRRIEVCRIVLRYIAVVILLAVVGFVVNWALGSFERPPPECDNQDTLGHQLACH